MKFPNQSDIIKLAAGGAAGYIGAQFLLPHKGFAKASCPSGKYWRGMCCNHIPYDAIKNSPDADSAAAACGWTFQQEDDYWRWAGGDPHGAAIGLPYQTAVRASSSPIGAIGGGIGIPGLDKIPIGWIITGGIVLALVLVLKR